MLQIADLPVEEFEALWSEYVNAYAECLLKANNDASSPAGKRLVSDYVGPVVVIAFAGEGSRRFSMRRVS